MAETYKGKRFGPFLMEKEVPSNGGMAMVYQARVVSSDYAATSRNLTVAVKIVREHPQYHKELEEMLVNETKLLSNLYHPGIVQIYPVILDGKSEWWRRQTVDGGSCPYYFAMEYLPKSLSKTSLTAYPIGWRVELINQIAQSLYFLHMQLIAHRDLKPENIMLRAEPQPKVAPQPVLIDFGISEKTIVRSRLGERALSLEWSAPERINAATKLDIKYDLFAADMWSFGMLCYWILTGKYAFGDMQQPRTAIIDAIQLQPPKTQPLMSNDIKPKLRDLILWMLNKDPATGKRPTIIDVVRSLRRDIEHVPPRV